LRFRLYQTLPCPIPGRSGALSRFFAFAFSLSSGSNFTRLFFRSVSGTNLNSGGLWSGLAFRLIRLYQKHIGRMNGLRFEIKGIIGSAG
ncbi:hypothetical protein, partial [Streptomyces sp. NPDC007346]|uniref:hypothetical protein n=1 Tax=Streptomyces sp. NPDC007346 TaxID=3154682 RepID=UPI0034561DB3